MLKNKIVAVGLTGVLTMSFGLAACGGQPAASSSESKASSSETEQAKDAKEAIKILYWEGTTSDGQSVVYMDDAETKTAGLVIVKSDASDGKGWSGQVAEANGKKTITDDITGETIAFAVGDVASDGTSLKVNIDGYGEVNMTPITAHLDCLLSFAKAAEGYIAAAATEAAAEAAEEISKTTLYWEGTLSDGSTVDYTDDAEAKEASLSITKADLSDGKVWSGKATVENGKTTITDNESKQTISFTVVSGDKNGSSLKLNIDGYGEVELKPVTGGDAANQIGQAVEEASKQAN